MDELFNNLLISSPNGGGLFFLYAGNAFKLDSFDTTGLSIKGKVILRGLQPSSVDLYGEGFVDVANKICSVEDVHDVYMDEQFVYLVGTSNNEIIKLSHSGEELQRWVFADEKDSYHINCLTTWNSEVVFSAFGEFREHRGYKGSTEKAGFVQELRTGRRLITGLSQPHSLVPVGQSLYLANSESKELLEYGPSGSLNRAIALDGYTRGICVAKNIAYVGLSRSRNIQSPGVDTATVVALDNASWRELGRFSLPVNEIYAIQELTSDDDAINALANIASKASFKLESIVTERDKQISILVQSLTQSDERIQILSESIVKRDDKISSLMRSVRECEVKIANLTQALAEREERIQSIYQSNSWKLTSPVREIAVNIKNLYLSFLNKKAWLHYLVSRAVRVVRYQGLYAFLRKGSFYLGSFWRRRMRAITFRSNAEPLLEELESAEPMVSFVIPIYDRTDVLRVAIQSALNQSYKNIEVLIVTDGSPSGTMSVVNEFINDSRVRIFNYPTSSGNAVRGRNKGILEAKGKYIAFLDSDDIASPDRVERSISLLESGQADVVYGAWRALLDGTRNVEGLENGQIIYSPDCDLETLKKICVPCQSTVSVRRQLLFRAGFLKPAMNYREDHELWVRLAHFGGRFKSIPHPLVSLRLHAGNNELNFKKDDRYWYSLLNDEYTKPGVIPKKIAFLVAGLGISGGLMVILKHANHLMAIGHDVLIINVGDSSVTDWLGKQAVPIVPLSDKRSYIFQNIDLLFATFWTTCQWLARIPAKRKLYFIQSDERLFYDDPALKCSVASTYKSTCEFVVVAKWINEMLCREFSKSSYLVPNGIDASDFYPDEPLVSKNSRRLRVLIEGPMTIPFKGVAEAYAAVAPLDCEIWIVSSAGRPDSNWRVDRFFERVLFNDMRKIYSSCDILLKMSRIESFSYPPLEAMACGCSVVVGKVAGSIEYVIDGVNALVVDQGDIEGAREAVKRLIEDSSLRGKLTKAGFDTVKKWSWSRSFEVMQKIVDGVAINE